MIAGFMKCDISFLYPLDRGAIYDCNIEKGFFEDKVLAPTACTDITPPPKNAQKNYEHFGLDVQSSSASRTGQTKSVLRVSAAVLK